MGCASFRFIHVLQLAIADRQCGGRFDQETTSAIERLQHATCDWNHWDLVTSSDCQGWLVDIVLQSGCWSVCRPVSGMLSRCQIAMARQIAKAC